MTETNKIPFVTKSFDVPFTAEAAHFHLRALSIDDVVKDYEAVITSREHLWHRFGEIWAWPATDISLEQNLIDLARHQSEFQQRTGFAYSVHSPDYVRVLGCVYIYPATSYSATTDVADAHVWFWARQSEIASKLEQAIETFLIAWLSDSWPFGTVRLNGKHVLIAAS